MSWGGAARGMRRLCSVFSLRRHSLRTEVRGPVLALMTALLLGACHQGKNEEPKAAKVTAWELFSPALIGKWQEAAMSKSGGIQREADGYSMKEGGPMTGIVFPSWFSDGMPATDYAITYEAMRVSGSDFFGSVTFPVRDEKTFATFVLGGWGGAQVGISNIDGFDAASNATGSSQHFENGKWYRVHIEVRAKELVVLLDGKRIVQTNIAGRSLGLRAGEIGNCVPFGFATYGTEGRARGCIIERLKAEPPQ